MRIGRLLAAAVLLLAGAGTSPPALAAKAIPAPPSHYVLDEPNVLAEPERRTLESLLIEHDRLTGEQVVVAVFKSLEGEDAADFSNQVFQRWGIGQRGKDNGALLAIYWDDHKSRIEVGYGLEGVLTDAKSKRILNDALAPGLRAGRAGEALQQSAFEILRVIGSPLVESGQAEAILRSSGWEPRSAPSRRSSSGAGWFSLVFTGLILLSILFNVLSSAEAHFTRKGWTRARPMERLRRTGLGAILSRDGWGGLGGGRGNSSWTGGGGGGGGFSGGGGRSGGGGASGSW